MKTLIDIQSDVIQKLDLIAKKRNVSRAHLVRVAIDLWLKNEASAKASPRVFGILKDKKGEDGVDLQRKLRGEWK